MNQICTLKKAADSSKNRWRKYFQLSWTKEMQLSQSTKISILEEENFKSQKWIYWKTSVTDFNFKALTV